MRTSGGTGTGSPEAHAGFLCRLATCTHVSDLHSRGSGAAVGGLPVQAVPEPSSVVLVSVAVLCGGAAGRLVLRRIGTSEAMAAKMASSDESWESGTDATPVVSPR